MGHESQIEPWLPLNQVLLAGFGTDRLRCEQAMNTADRRKPKPLGHSAQQPRSWRGRSEQISFDQVGCEARKIPASGEISFLTSSFIERTRSEQRIMEELFLDPDSDLRTHKSIRVARYDSKYAIDIA